MVSPSSLSGVVGRGGEGREVEQTALEVIMGSEKTVGGDMERVRGCVDGRQRWQEGGRRTE